MLYFRARQWVPVRNAETVTLYETDDDRRVLRYVVVGGDQVDLARGPSFWLEPGPALESCLAEEFLQRWSPERAPARNALPDLPEEPPALQGEVSGA